MVPRSLLNLNTFRVDHSCRSISYTNSSNDLVDLAKTINKPIIVGGGSNILFVDDVDRDVIVINHEGIEVIKTTNKYVYIRVQAGTNWHQLVLWAIENDLGGIENLSLIPGKCGAAPMQNIGAYGVELKNVFVELECVKIGTGERWVLHKEDCLFGYRESIFKGELKDKVIIDNITLRLTTNSNHTLNRDYGIINDKLDDLKVKKPTIKDISDVIIDIRKSKLPDPKEYPNAGSFFKNPIISTVKLKSLKSTYKYIPSYVIDNDSVKVPAGWLIDKAGWKGKQINGVGTYKHQALVIVNHSARSGKEILEFSKLIQDDVLEKYGIKIEREVNVY